MWKRRAPHGHTLEPGTVTPLRAALQRPAPFRSQFVDVSHGCFVLIEGLIQQTVTFLMLINLLNISSVSIMAFCNWVEVDLMCNWFILTYQERHS